VGTPVAPEAGLVTITVGRVVSAVLPVLKLQTWLLPRALPAELCADVLMVAVYGVLGSKFVVGANVTVLVAATYVTVPDTAAPPTPATATVNVPGAITVAEFMASLNVAVIFWFIGTLITPFRGFVEITVGLPVVKVQTKLLARPLPSGSFAPVVIVAVNCVLPARGAAGVNVAVVPEYVTVPATEVPPGPVIVKVDVLIVVAFIALLKVAVIISVIGTLVAPFAGPVEATEGAAGPDVYDRPHPARKPAIRNASIQTFCTVTLLIRSISS